MGITLRNLGSLCTLPDAIAFLKAQYSPFPEPIGSPEQRLTSHTTNFTSEGSTAIKNTVRSSMQGMNCCLFPIFPF